MKRDKKITVVFEDRGQDFLEFDIENNQVVDCRPFQAFLWVGKKIKGDIKIGGKLSLKDLGTLKYKIIAIRQ